MTAQPDPLLAGPVGSGRDQRLDLASAEDFRQRPAEARRVEIGRRVVGAAAVADQKTEELPHRRQPPRQGPRRQTARRHRAEIVAQRRRHRRFRARRRARRERPRGPPDRRDRRSGSAAPRRARPRAFRERLRAAAASSTRSPVAASTGAPERLPRTRCASLREAVIRQHLLDRLRRHRKIAIGQVKQAADDRQHDDATRE